MRRETMTSTILLVYNGSGQSFFMGRCGELTVHVCEVGEAQASILFRKHVMWVNMPEDVELKDMTLGDHVKSEGDRFKIRYDHSYILSKGELVILELVPFIRVDADTHLLSEGRTQCMRTQMLTYYYHDKQ